MQPFAFLYASGKLLAVWLGWSVERAFRARFRALVTNFVCECHTHEVRRAGEPT